MHPYRHLAILPPSQKENFDGVAIMQYYPRLVEDWNPLMRDTRQAIAALPENIRWIFGEYLHSLVEYRDLRQKYLRELEGMNATAAIMVATYEVVGKLRELFEKTKIIRLSAAGTSSCDAKPQDTIVQ